MKLQTSLNRPSGLGTTTALGTAAGVLILCAIFEFIVPEATNPGTVYLSEKNFNYRSIILYATAGGVHTLLCCGGIALFFAQLQREQTGEELKKIISYTLITFAVIFVIVLLACCLNISVVQHSFAERVLPLQGDPRLAFLFASHLVPLTPYRFPSFALFPLALIAFGVAVAVVACFWISHKAVKFADKSDDLSSREIKELKASLTQLISLTAIIFTTSTVATIALMQIGRDWIEKGAGRDAYIQNGFAMSIFWSACYTCVIILMVILPLCWIVARTRRVQRQAKHAGGRASFFDQIFEIITYKSIAQAGAATLAPLLTSSFAAVFGS